jgi:hypothetical protein
MVDPMTCQRMQILHLPGCKHRMYMMIADTEPWTRAVDTSRLDWSRHNTSQPVRPGMIDVMTFLRMQILASAGMQTSYMVIGDTKPWTRGVDTS